MNCIRCNNDQAHPRENAYGEVVHLCKTCEVALAKILEQPMHLDCTDCDDCTEHTERLNWGDSRGF